MCGEGDDTITGNDQDNYLFGEDGTDTLNGEAGNDFLIGGTGNDTVNGGAGNDILIGEVVTGGGGNDIFEVLYRAAETSAMLHVIKDFDLTEDKIYFRDFPEKSGNNRNLSVASGKISVGGTEYIIIHNDAGTADNDKATKIKDDSTRYRFVKPKWDENLRKNTYTDN